MYRVLPKPSHNTNGMVWCISMFFLQLPSLVFVLDEKTFDPTCIVVLSVVVFFSNHGLHKRRRECCWQPQYHAVMFLVLCITPMVEEEYNVQWDRCMKEKYHLIASVPPTNKKCSGLQPAAPTS